MIALARYMILTRGRETVRVTKVQGHAEDVDVQQGRVRLLDQQGNASVGSFRLEGIGFLLCWICIDL